MNDDDSEVDEAPVPIEEEANDINDEMFHINIEDDNEDVPEKIVTIDVRDVIPMIDDENIKNISEDLKANPWDINTWNVLLSYIKDFPMGVARGYYESLLKQFPTCAQFWEIYIAREIAESEVENIDEMIETSLEKFANVKLYNFYINYIIKKQFENYEECTQDEQLKRLDYIRNILINVKNKIGFCIHSCPLWIIIFAFYQNYLPLRIDELRRLYFEALSLPLYELDKIWNNYIKWEENINVMELAKHMPEIKPLYTEAERIFNLKKSIWKNLRVGDPPKPPTGTKDEREQINLWKSALNFELANPERLPQEIHRNRIETLYIQCLCVLRYHPDFWYDFAIFEYKQQDVDKAISIFEDGCFILDDSLVFQFAYLDYLESIDRKDNIINKYEDLLSHCQDQITDADTIVDEQRRQKKLQILSNQKTLIYTTYQKYLLRNSGMEGVRSLFQRAIHDQYCGYLIYITTAYIEYYDNYNKDFIRKLLNSGYQRYNQVPGFILNYCKFLQLLGDIDKIKIIYESSLSTLPPSQCNELWYHYIYFITWFLQEGKDMNLLGNLEKRWSESISRDFGGMLNQIHRYEFSSVYSTVDFDRSVRERSSELSKIPIPGMPLCEKYKDQINKDDIKITVTTSTAAPRIPQLVAQWKEFLPETIDEEISIDRVEMIIKELSEGVLIKPDSNHMMN